MPSTTHGQIHAADRTSLMRRGGIVHKKTVVLVEENRLFRHIIENELTALGYRILTASDPARADFQIKLQLADIVMVSFHWNRGSGWKLYNLLKKRYSELPVLLYTMEDRPSLGVKAIAEALAEAFSLDQRKPNGAVN